MTVTVKNRPGIVIPIPKKLKPRKRHRSSAELAARFEDGIPIRTLVDIDHGTNLAEIDLDTEHAAHWLGLSIRTMESMRHKGTGPPCKRGFGKSYMYRFGDLQTFKATYRKWSKKK